MHVTHRLRQISNQQALENLKNIISKTIVESAPHIRAIKEKQVKILSQKFSQFNNWYMKVTGLDKVLLAQEKVTGLQNQLFEIQQKRRDVGKQLSEMRLKSMELQDEIHKVKRQDDLEKFLDLMKRETEVLKLEKSISKIFQEYDQAERELFTAFTDSIRDSHEKQRAQMEYTKYFGLILSISGSFLAFLYSTIKKDQLKKMIDERLQTLENVDGKIFVSKIVAMNNELKNEVVANRKALNDLKKIIYNTDTLKRSENSNPILLSSISENKSDKVIGYVFTVGTIFCLTLFLIGRALS